MRVQQRALRVMHGAGGSSEGGGLKQSVVLVVTCQQMNCPSNDAERLEMLRAALRRSKTCVGWMTRVLVVKLRGARLVLAAQLRQAPDELGGGGGVRGVAGGGGFDT